MKLTLGRGSAFPSFRMCGGFLRGPPERASQRRPLRPSQRSSLPRSSRCIQRERSDVLQVNKYRWASLFTVDVFTVLTIQESEQGETANSEGKNTVSA